MSGKRGRPPSVPRERDADVYVMLEIVRRFTGLPLGRGGKPGEEACACELAANLLAKRPWHESSYWRPLQAIPIDSPLFADFLCIEHAHLSARRPLYLSPASVRAVYQRRQHKRKVLREFRGNLLRP